MNQCGEYRMSDKEKLGIGIALLNQFAASWKMIRQAIECVPDEFWHKGVNQWFFSILAYHIVETADYYASSDPKAMTWGQRAGYDWEDVKDIEKDVLPRITKDLVLSYLKDVEEQIDNLLSSMSNDAFFNKDGFDRFSSILEKLVYLLRHNMFHIGELFRALREWGCERPKWA